MYKKASNEPIVSTMIKDNDGLEFVGKLQTQVAWAKGLDDAAFAIFFHRLIKAHKKWEEIVGSSKQILMTNSSKTAHGIVEFLETIGDNKWSGLDAEMELLAYVK